MIRKIRPNLYVADKEDKCGENIILIREDDNTLWHICQREPGKWGVEEYLVGKVAWDPLGVSYFCMRRECNAKLELADVWSDLEGGTGCEHKC